MLVKDLEDVLEESAPKSLAEPGDNCGLLVGDEAAQVSRILIALELTESVCDEATAGGYDTVLTHHPLVYSPLRSLVESRPVERLARRLIRGRINLLSWHTNLDAASGGLADIASEALGLRDTLPLRLASANWCKLVGFVPPEAADDVAAAVFAAGAGTIGEYRECAFTAEGVGWFTAGEGANPAVGRVAVPERTPELRWETVVPRARVPAVISAFVRAHPYEEPAFDVYPVEDVLPRVGLGRLGTRSAPISVRELASLAVRAFELSTCTWSGNGARLVSRVGVLPGGGRGFIAEAAGCCDVLITGDLTYHDAAHAEGAGLSLIAAPHGEFEWWAFRRWGESLGGKLEESGVTVTASKEWRSPWNEAGTSAAPAAETADRADRERSSKVRLWIDGGSRGNPGASAIGVVLEDWEGEVIASQGRFIGVTTNNVAEYRALLTGLEMARAEGAREVEVLSDSELLVKQMLGEYQVRSQHLKPLHEEAASLMGRFEKVVIRHVDREKNVRADALVNQALDEGSRD